MREKKRSLFLSLHRLTIWRVIIQCSRSIMSRYLRNIFNNLCIDKLSGENKIIHFC